jgi:hypothetical protein
MALSWKHMRRNDLMDATAMLARARANRRRDGRASVRTQLIAPHSSCVCDRGDVRRRIAFFVKTGSVHQRI